jgi:hypothetical protein
MERLMDRVARELKLDRAEVRRRNFIQPQQMPYQVGIIFRDGRPVTYDSGDYPACQTAALEAADYAGFVMRQAEARKSGRHLGIGISNAVEATGLGPYEGATARIATSGKISVYTGATPQGRRRLQRCDGGDRGHGVDFARHGHLRGAYRRQRRLLGSSGGVGSRREGQETRGGHDGMPRGGPRARRRLRARPTSGKVWARSRSSR